MIEKDSGTAFHPSEMLDLIGLVVRIQMKRKDSFIERRNINIAISAERQVPYRF